MYEQDLNDGWRIVVREPEGREAAIPLMKNEGSLK